jgi:hypothetical protein
MILTMNVYFESIKPPNLSSVYAKGGFKNRECTHR